MVKNLNIGQFLERRPDSVLRRAFRRQLLATLTVNIITFSHGIGLGWLSPTLTRLQSPESPLDFTVSIVQASWVGSLLGLGSLTGNIFFGKLLDLAGRKACIYLLAVPHICLWVLIYSAQSVEFLYVGRFLGGFTGGSSYVVLPIYISEIADTSIRGTLSTLVILSVNTGILVGYILSTHLGYFLVPSIIVTLPIIYFLWALYFPETPQHLLRKQKILEAEKSFKFYKNLAKDANAIEVQQCHEQFEDLKVMIAKGTAKGDLTLSDFTNASTLKAFCTALVVLIVNQCCGIFAFVNYMSIIFIESGSSMDPNTGTIIMGLVQIIGAYATTLLVDRFGRKILMLVSAGGSALFLAIFGFYTNYVHLLPAMAWAPLVLMTCIVFLANAGIVVLTFVLIVELFPSKIRSFAASLCMAVLSFFVFSMLKIFPIYMVAFGISVTMWSCAIVTAFSFVYLAIFLPETKDKCMDAD